MVSAVFCMALTSCSESNELEVVDSVISTTGEEDYKYVGKETAGLPKELLRKNADRAIRIPMGESQRSLNLSNSVAIVLYEALRQNNFLDLV